MSAAPRSFEQLERAYALVRSQRNAPARITLLHIGTQTTLVLARDGDRPGDVVSLALGSEQLAQACFAHDPPKPAELEHAIDLVENELTRAHPPPADGGALFTVDEAVRAFARIGGSPAAGSLVMTRDAAEHLFERLASASLGQPRSLDGMPSGRESAATLLILRELMHHLAYPSVTVLDGPGRLSDARHALAPP